MKFLFSFVLAGIFAVLGQQSLAQSGRTETKTDSKSNQRLERPEPTPPKNLQKEISPSIDTDGDIIRVSTQLVSVPVRVMDKKGRFIAGLEKDNFKIFEDGAEQEVALFSKETEPFTVALVLDMSYSAKFKISEIQSAAVAFIDQLRPQDKVIVVSFDAEVHVLTDATSDRKEIFRAIKSTKIGMGTSLYEAMDLVINGQMRKIEGRKAVILFSDGVDTTSRRSHDLNNLHDAMELDALIYSIKYDTFADVQRMKNGPIIQQPTIKVPTTTDDPNPFPFPLPTAGTAGTQGTTAEDYQKAAEYLDQLAIRSGGRLYEATSLGNLAEAYAKIASELREFYSVAFYPSRERQSGDSTSVKVKVDRDGAVVRSREIFTKRTLPKKAR